MIGAIYCRVSTEEQEREGTSLDSQLEACIKKAQELGYETGDHTIKETWSGLTLDRPKLTEIRQRVRNKEVDAVIAYTLDRLSRDPVHFIILQEEMERANVGLYLVTETVDSTDLGKLISHIRGYAAKLEAEKIRERTMRGKRARALAGKLPAGSHARLYGYLYIKKEGKRIINDQEAKHVQDMFSWLVNEGLSTNAITYRLRDLNVPTPSGKGWWKRDTVLKILKNTSYIGKVYAFTRTYTEPDYRMKPNTKRKKTKVVWKPQSEWILIENVSPPIISESVFNIAQQRLEENRKMATRNAKNQYLLHGHIYCARCGRAYWGAAGIKSRNGKRYEYPFYHCSGRLKKVTPIKCDNRQHNAKRLEALVWAEVEKILNQPELILSELQRKEQEQEAHTWQKELEMVIAQLDNRKHQKQRIWYAYEITGDEETFRRDIAKVEKELQDRQKRKGELEAIIESSQQLILSADDLKRACEIISNNLKQLDFKEKRLTLQALQIRVLIDGVWVTVQGAIPMGCVETAVSRWHRPAQHPES